MKQAIFLWCFLLCLTSSIWGLEEKDVYGDWVYGVANFDIVVSFYNDGSFSLFEEDDETSQELGSGNWNIEEGLVTAEFHFDDDEGVVVAFEMLDGEMMLIELDGENVEDEELYFEKVKELPLAPIPNEDEIYNEEVVEDENYDEEAYDGEATEDENYDEETHDGEATEDENYDEETYDGEATEDENDDEETYDGEATEDENYDNYDNENQE
ncbi:hypothetical protein [Candidatus Uabimicrobium sp. HlEnr_7]|uniref:hypothetical protein n=1 Tax=Candidatus Uabimicrobium helgolandensis TaxID=3095367 RepID=UPI0035582ACA